MVFDHFRNAERGAAFGIERLVGVDRDWHQRQSMGECLGDGAEAGMGDHEIAVRKQDVLWDVALDVDVVRPRAELVGILIAADGQDQVEGLVAQSVEDRSK
jgi:hypothetical protein